MTDELIKIFCDKHRVKKLYAYHEEKNGSSVKYGWVTANDIAIDQGVVLSYPSRTRKTKEQKEWSDKEGVTAVSLPDCRAFFVSSTGYQPEKFIELSDELPGSFIESWLEGNPGHTEDEFLFIASLANLICEEKSFNMLGRGFKVIFE